jgi:hypothetical protein
MEFLTLITFILIFAFIATIVYYGNEPYNNEPNRSFVLERKFITKNGEAVYSKGEKEIADFLKKCGWKYEYEPEIRVDGRRYCPDFYLPKTNLYIEYMGMWEDQECQQEYRRKMATYLNNGMNVIFLYPSQKGKLGDMIMWYSRRDRLKVG